MRVDIKAIVLTSKTVQKKDKSGFVHFAVVAQVDKSGKCIDVSNVMSDVPLDVTGKVTGSEVPVSCDVNQDMFFSRKEKVAA